MLARSIPLRLSWNVTVIVASNRSNDIAVIAGATVSISSLGAITFGTFDDASSNWLIAVAVIE